jgi:hypothetical protein
MNRRPEGSYTDRSLVGNHFVSHIGTAVDSVGKLNPSLEAMAWQTTDAIEADKYSGRLMTHERVRRAIIVAFDLGRGAESTYRHGVAFDRLIDAAAEDDDMHQHVPA